MLRVVPFLVMHRRLAPAAAAAMACTAAVSPVAAWKISATAAN